MPSEPLSVLCDHLEALAAKATPGPWRAAEPAPWNVLAPHSAAEDVVVTTSGLYADARYLASLDPATVLRLCAAVEVAGRLAEVHETVAKLRAQIGLVAAVLMGPKYDGRDVPGYTYAESPCEMAVRVLREDRAEIERLTAECDESRAEAEAWKGHVEALVAWQLRWSVIDTDAQSEWSDALAAISPCEKCGGSGIVSAPYETDAEDCPVCRGTGRKPMEERDNG